MAQICLFPGSRQRAQMNVCIKGSANMCTVYLSNTPPGGRYIGCWDLPGLICNHPVEAFEVVAPEWKLCILSVLNWGFRDKDIWIQGDLPKESSEVEMPSLEKQGLLKLVAFEA